MNERTRARKEAPQVKNTNIKHWGNAHQCLGNPSFETPDERAAREAMFARACKLTEGEPGILANSVMLLDRNSTVAGLQGLAIALLISAFALLFSINDVQFPTIPAPDIASRSVVNLFLGGLGALVGLVFSHIARMPARLGRVLGKMGARLGTFVFIIILMGMLTMLVYSVDPTSSVMMYLAIIMSLPVSIGTCALLRRSKVLFGISIIALLSGTLFSRNIESDLIFIVISCALALLYIEIGELSIRLGEYWQSIREESAFQLARDDFFVVKGRNVRKKNAHAIIDCAKRQKENIEHLSRLGLAALGMGVLASAALVGVIIVVKLLIFSSSPHSFVDSIEARTAYGFAIPTFVVLAVAMMIKYCRPAMRWLRKRSTTKDA